MIWLLTACSGGLDDTFFLRVDGADLMIDVEGSPDAGVFVLLLHGGPGGNSQEYNMGTWAARLEEEVAMVYLDQRGQGASQGAYAVEDVTVTRMAEDVAVVIDALKVRYGDDIALYLLGHSWGGLLGTAALLQDGVQDEVAGWIEVDGAHDVPLLNTYAVPMLISQGEVELEAGNNTETWTEIVEFAEGVDTDQLTAEDSLLINQYAYDAEALIDAVTFDEGLSPLELVGYAIASQESPLTALWTGGLTNLQLDLEVEQTSLTAKLSRIDVPTLLLWGRYDFVVPPGLGEDALARIPDSRLVMLETSGHSPMFNQPDEFVDSILGFIDETR